MVTNESKKFPPLSDPIKAALKEYKLLEKEFNEKLKVQKQVLKDLQNGLRTQAEFDELEAIFNARASEIKEAMFKLAGALNTA